MVVRGCHNRDVIGVEGQPLAGLGCGCSTYPGVTPGGATPRLIIGMSLRDEEMYGCLGCHNWVVIGGRNRGSYRGCYRGCYRGSYLGCYRGRLILGGFGGGGRRYWSVLKIQWDVVGGATSCGANRVAERHTNY